MKLPEAETCECYADLELKALKRMLAGEAFDVVAIIHPDQASVEFGAQPKWLRPK